MFNFRKKIEKNTIVAFYNGIRILPGSSESKTWDEDGYKIFDPSTKPAGTIDIPEKFRDLKNYCASLAHKTNHSFIPRMASASVKVTQLAMVTGSEPSMVKLAMTSGEPG